MHWYRSFPLDGERRAIGRAHVVDSLPRLVMRDCDYSTVKGGLPVDEPGFCMLEWDVALGRRERDLFAEMALTDPDRVMVAPYDIFPEGQPPTLVHRHAADIRKPGHRVPVAFSMTECHSFGFGCIYLPRSVVVAWQKDKPSAFFNDARFSDWHIARYGTARVIWDVHPQHLHGD